MVAHKYEEKIKHLGQQLSDAWTPSFDFKLGAAKYRSWACIWPRAVSLRPLHYNNNARRKRKLTQTDITQLNSTLPIYSSISAPYRKENFISEYLNLKDELCIFSPCLCGASLGTPTSLHLATVCILVASNDKNPCFNFDEVYLNNGSHFPYL